MGDCVEIDAEGKHYSTCSPDSIPVLMRESPTIVKLAKTAKCSELPLEELEIDPSIPPPDFSKRVYEFRSGYVTCQLCRNVISASRFSNLSNHARRHASIKKYKCVYCDVQLNELSKMRAHMFHAHEDDTSEAIDNTSSETQRVWDFLILKCFPLCGTTAAQFEESKGTSKSGNSGFICGICGHNGFDMEDIHNHITVRHLRREPNFENEEALFVLGPGVKQEEKTPSGGAVTPSGMESRISKVNLPLEHLQKAVIGNYVEERMDDESTLACRLCNRMLDGKDLMGILMHAKAHYHIKQFECELCGHGSNTIGLVRRHIEVQHPLDSTDIIEHCDENMKKAWTQVIRVCFPSLPELLKSERDNSAAARLAKEEMLWREFSPTDRLLVYNNNIVVEFPLLGESVQIDIDGDVRDACMTHNYLAIATDSRLYLIRKDDLDSPLCCDYGNDGLRKLGFEPPDLPLTITRSTIPEEQPTMDFGWPNLREPSSDVILTSTLTTIYLVTTENGVSRVTRLFNEDDCARKRVISCSVVQNPDDVRIVAATSGYDHSLFLTEKGAVHALGTGSRGELGIGLAPRVTELTELEALEGVRVRRIVAAGWHSGALTAEGDVYLWGWNHRGQLGQEKEAIELYPSPLDTDLMIKRIEMRPHQTALWTAEDEEYPSIMFGTNDIGMPPVTLRYFDVPLEKESKLTSTSKKFFPDDPTTHLSTNLNVKMVFVKDGERC
ncbi:unnamed protein product [Nippostrongylus brasiliensis]|uniref:C2H2-type domain-containing protein n=1 Tax=Nippostrongylus brasiliensis TaxID=27835 RepID=A0A0N4YJX4_NIPBR|nr:unnamed protein product [Nippostrongylus brasiliensis]